VWLVLRAWPRGRFAIGQYAFKNISEADKAKYKAKILQTGSFVGYKEAGHWKIGEVKDRIEVSTPSSKVGSRTSLTSRYTPSSLTLSNVTSDPPPSSQTSPPEPFRQIYSR
jgi:hypothetical protein